MGLMGVLAVASMGNQAIQQKRIQKQMRRSQEAQRRMQEIKMNRERERLLAEQQQRQANIVATSAAQGVQGSSMEQQAISSLDTQLNTELNFLETTADIQEEQAQAQTNINQIQGQHQLVSSVFDVAKPYAQQYDLK